MRWPLIPRRISLPSQSYYSPDILSLKSVPNKTYCFNPTMSATTTDLQRKAQPWKAHWSPVDMKSASANQNYMVDDTDSLLIDGACEGLAPSELAYARKETEAPKAQPWKAHWSPVDMKSASANQNYMVDDTDSLLIDGACEGLAPSELACARKETEAPKTQPWKSHWPPVNMQSSSPKQNYMVDDTNSLLIDGSGAPGGGGGYPPFELAFACSRKAKE